MAQFTFKEELRKQILESMQSVAPNGRMSWRFSGIQVAGAETHGTGLVKQVVRSSKGGLITIDAAARIVGKLVYKGPVRINGVDGRVEQLARGAFGVQFDLEGMSHGSIVTLAAGKMVEIVADPTIQITYKATPASRPPGETLSSYWEVQNPTTGFAYREMRKDASDLPATLTVSARVVDADGTTVVRYVNLPQTRTGFETSVTIRYADMGVLYRVGRFPPNFVRGFALIFVQLAFLAALGVLAGSFVSFPVACLACFTMLPFQLGREFIVDAVNVAAVREGFLGRVSYYIVKLMNVLLPDFERTSPGESLVDGMNISWVFLGETFLWAFCVQTALLLLIACLIFRKRELARVQV